MAEALVTDSNISEKKDALECAVCLQPCVHPAQLPCGHIFCYLCVKGFANQNKKCAMCRQEIPRDFVDQPNLLERPQPLESLESFDGGYQWFYEGRNGWWCYDKRANEDIEAAFKLDLPRFELILCGELYVIDYQNNFQYPKSNSSRKRSIRRDKIKNVTVKGVAGLSWWQYDERTSKELETSYKKGEKSSEVLIAGFLYVVDLENMVQLRRNDPSRRRNIKRDLASIAKKGIAGLRTTTDTPTPHSADIRPASPIDGRTDNVVPITPSNTPQSPTSGRESPSREEDLQATVERISNLRLDSNEDNEGNRCGYYSHQSTD